MNILLYSVSNSEKAQAPWGIFPLELRNPPSSDRKLEPHPEADTALLPSPQKSVAAPKAFPPPADKEQPAARLLT